MYASRMVGSARSANVEAEWALRCCSMQFWLQEEERRGGGGELTWQCRVISTSFRSATISVLGKIQNLLRNFDQSNALRASFGFQNSNDNSWARLNQVILTTN